LEKTSRANRGSLRSAASDIPKNGLRDNNAGAPAIRKSAFRYCRRLLTALGGDPNLLNEQIRPKEMAMKWKTPVIIEIAVGLEINAYACAEVK
jgi:coenzyme PQQ precursor peptide PqqA